MLKKNEFQWFIQLSNALFAPPSENDVVQYHVLENDRDSERLMLRHIMLPSYLTGLVLASEFSNPCLKSRDSMV
jgi:hypothetical protein